MLTLEDVGTYSTLFEIAKKYGVDPSSSLQSEAFFESLLKSYPGRFDDKEEIATWLDARVQQHFVALDQRPEWIQDPEWAFADGKPMVFAGQINISTEKQSLPLFHDDTSLYVFIASEAESVVIVQQY